MTSKLDTEEGSMEELRAFARYCEGRGMTPQDASKLASLFLVSFVFSEPAQGQNVLELLNLVRSGVDQAMTLPLCGKKGMPC
jgi:hypothetical protein